MSHVHRFEKARTNGGRRGDRAELGGGPCWPKAKSRVIKVAAKKFEFVPGEIHVKQGETRRGRSRSSAMSSAAPGMKT